MEAEPIHFVFDCQKCAFKCSKNGDWNRHIASAKHKILMNPNEITSPAYKCNCGKIYKHMTSLCFHKKKCKENDKNTFTNETKNSLIIQLLKQNQELQITIIDYIKTLKINDE
jgi:hypothetical protein